MQGIHGPMSFRLETGLVAFTVLVFILGFFMSLGKAAVYKHIPVYYPKHVGSVGGIVGLIGGLGGFVLPILFGLANDLTDVWHSCFMLLFATSLTALVWMHLAIRQMEREAAGVAPDEAARAPRDVRDPQARGAQARRQGAGDRSARCRALSCTTGVRKTPSSGARRVAPLPAVT